ncbi:MAG: hypothetical protein WCG23_07795 [bacterium]
MLIEFTTTIDDYDFPNIPEKIFTALKDNMVCTLLFKKVQTLKVTKSKDIIENQTYWSLI